uniref:Uncharacterized protein n=1 Tax=Fagus sylvatica TaxID=28930 RepID=A0A2N9F8I8_FAGSY
MGVSQQRPNTHVRAKSATISISSNSISISLSQSLSLPIRRIQRGCWLVGPLDGVGGGRKRGAVDTVSDGGCVVVRLQGLEAGFTITMVDSCFPVWLAGWVSASQCGQ